MVNNKTISRRHFIGSITLASAGVALISSCKSSPYETGCFTRPWSKFDYRVAFDGIAGAGFTLAGLMGSDKGLIITADTTPEQAAKVREEARSRNLKIASMWGNVEVRNSVAAGVAGLTRLIENASYAGCATILLGGTSEPKLVDAYYQAIAECCDLAAEKGVGLCLKPHGGPNTTGAECRALIDRVGHKSFTLWYDPGNIYWYTHGKLDPVDDALDVDGLVTGMCVKDFMLPREINITPGTGMVDFPEVFARLRRGGFTRGPLVVECLPLGEPDHINAEARKARLFLEELTA
jgi:sugar phosphate isomerase/epimerase